ncbi:MAG TPA: Uma2 family endonuclease [Gemmatimonadales bacterium]|nr:Uma2 family endonuclease [Gemmatimonadales bacterium]
MGMSAPIYYTAEMVRALPEDGNRYETVHGELLVTPAPRVCHQVVVERLRDALGIYLARHREWQLLAAPADISWTPDVLVQPDLFVVPIDEARTLDWARLRHLELVVEVLSPTTARAERSRDHRGPKLGTSGTMAQGFIVADGRRLERDIGYALLRAAGSEAPDLVVFAEANDMCLLGAHSLEGLNLKIDPVRKQLAPAGPVISAEVA